MDSSCHHNNLKKMSNRSFERKLGLCERFYWRSNEKKPFNMCIVLRFKGFLSQEDLKRAVRNVQFFHPFLQIAVKKKLEKPFFSNANIKEIPINFIKRKQENSWKAVLKKELHEPFFYEEGPLMRVAYLQGVEKHELLFTFDHLIADGISCISVIEKTLAFFNSDDNAKDVLDSSKNFQYVLPLEDLVTNEFTKKNENANFFKKIENKYEYCGQIGTPNKSGIATFSLSKEQTNNLINLCRENNTTVQGALFAAISFALLKKIKKENPFISSNVKIMHHCPINIRHLLKFPSSAKDLGAHISMYSFVCDMNDQTSFWEHARNVKEKIHSQLNQELPLKTIEGLTFLLKSPSTYRDLRLKRKWIGPLVGVSNLGRIQLKNSSKTIQITEVYPAGALHGMFYNENNVYIIALTFCGQLFLTLVYPQGLLKAKKATEILQSIIESLSKI